MTFLRRLQIASLLCVLTSQVSSKSTGPAPNQIKNLVTFGDSYTDVTQVGDNGTAWPVYAARDGNFSLFPYARAGATCSNNLTNRPFPSVFEGQLPLYFEEKSNGSLESLQPEDTIYTLWIGTNDVGANALLTGSQAPGVTLVDTISCAVNWVTALYDSGARNFLFQNMIPLQHVVGYSLYSYPNPYWTIEHNTTEWNVFMTELTNSGNALSKLMLEALAPKLTGAHIGLFDSYALFSDMISNPQNYLNGTAPLNVTGCIKSCIYAVNESQSGPADCTFVTGTDEDSFLWWDEIHPSEQADRVVAREIAAAIQGNSSEWTTWLS